MARLKSYNEKGLIAVITKMAVLIVAVLFFISVIKLYGNRDYIAIQWPLLIFISCSAAGLLSGKFGEVVFLQQSKRSQTRIFLLLAGLATAGSVFTIALINHIYPITASKLSFVVLALLATGFSGGLTISLWYFKIKQQVTAAESRAAHNKSELQLLQSQLSPHFLFNTLNNLYGISLNEPGKISGMLLKLSELLRYSVYDAKDTFVSLKDEISYLKNYIGFEAMRIGDRLNLKTEFEEIATEQTKIAPLLLVAFAENAFKHAKNNLDNKILVDIRLKLYGNSIVFTVKNSSIEWKDTGSTISKHSGFGLQNVIKRLEMLYPDAHHLEIKKNEDTFTMLLKVNVKEYKK